MPPKLTIKIIGDFVYLMWQNPAGQEWFLDASDDEGQSWHISPLPKVTTRPVREVEPGVWMVGPKSEFVVAGPDEPLQLFRLFEWDTVNNRRKSFAPASPNN